MLFVQYLLKPKIKYLLISVMLIAISFFSMQRASTLPGIMAIFLISLIGIFKGIPVASRRSLAVLSTGIFIISIITIEFPDSKLVFAMNRYIGITEEEEEVEQSAFSDTGHREQALLTFYSAWKEKTFWGLGYGKTDQLYLEGQTGNIHNAYASIWAHQGIVSVLFYVARLS